jgi:hypothetical protein
LGTKPFGRFVSINQWHVQVQDHEVGQIFRLEFFHYDFALQALSKLERGHAQDLKDVTSFMRGGHITADELRSKFQQIKPGLLRYPALDPQQFEQKIEDFLKNPPSHDDNPP